ncbi:MAG: GntR family transcriptional regulator [Spirochaetaceae bacterium]|nr:MAG: GntR family transcriptional regulator [Spirochaetaceae bacterium]
MNKKTVLKSIRDQIYEAIQESIINNTYKPGEELQIDRLAEEFGVSTTPIREALIRLENTGLVHLIPNKGARVTSFREKDILDTWEIRKLLEPYAAGITAELDVRDDILEIEAACDKLEQGPQDSNLYIQSDIRLHELLYAHLSNELLKDTLRNILQRSMRMRYFAEDVSKMHDQVVREVLSEHKEILRALSERDREKTIEAVRRHVANGERRALTAIRLRNEN